MTFDVWALTPEQLTARSLGSPGDAAFSMLQRPWRWGQDGPIISRRKRHRFESAGMQLPRHIAERRSSDGAVKVLLAYGDDRIEAIHMPRAIGTGRVSLCLSSQVGCAMGCAFCATAQLGFSRHLSAGEIVVQVLTMLWKLGPRHPSDLTLVFMGMGEPLHNLSQVNTAIEVLCHPLGLGLSPRRITVSTVGLLPAIRQLATFRCRPLLAVSLNATTQVMRRSLMPIGQHYSLPELKTTLLHYPLRKGERILIEYVLIAGENDTFEDALRLSQFLSGLSCHLNLIPFNEFPGTLFRAPSDAALDAFARQLLSFGPAIVTVRRSRGVDVDGACGQLAARGLS